jgi:AhpD family alkylhydroperoxidase
MIRGWVGRPRTKEVMQMGDYEETLEDIETSLGIVPGFMKNLADDVLIKEWSLFKKYVLGKSAIPAKYREMIGLAIAATSRCPYCTLFHTGAAKIHGATEAELQEIVFLASFSGRWSTMLFAQQYDMDKFTEEVHKIGAHLRK